MIVPTLRVGMPFRTLCVPRLTRSVSHCVTTRSVGTIKPIKAADRLCCMRSALAPARSGAERRLCVRHKSRLWQAERRRCVGGCAAWMPRKPPFGQGWPVGGVPPEQCRSRGTPTKEGPDREPEPLVTWGYQVTRRRRNHSGVSQNKVRDTRA
jgi:hypothetical protein